MECEVSTVNIAMSENAASYPSIDPSFFDLILIGTGLPESILAAAASSAAKSVLHLDGNPFYGTHFSSLSLDDFTSFLQSQRSIPLTPTQYSPTSTDHDAEYITIDLKPRRLYTHIDVSFFQPSQTLGPSRSFALDLSGPRVLFCADPMVDLMLKSGASHHIEFKSVDASLLFCDGRFLPVPDSRSAIFKDRTLGLMEKSHLMRFFKLVQEHFDGSDVEKRISEEDLESPFIDFLNKQQLPPKIKSIILYAIAMAEYDQDSPEGCKNLVKTKNGMKNIALYSSSVGRFPNALGAFIYPIYGQGELPQAFCRCAAVKGALYELSPVLFTLMKSTKPFLDEYYLLDLEETMRRGGFVNVVTSLTDPRHRTMTRMVPR